MGSWVLIEIGEGKALTQLSVDCTRLNIDRKSHSKRIDALDSDQAGKLRNVVWLHVLADTSRRLNTLKWRFSAKFLTRDASFGKDTTEHASEHFQLGTVSANTKRRLECCCELKVELSSCGTELPFAVMDSTRRRFETVTTEGQFCLRVTVFRPRHGDFDCRHRVALQNNVRFVS